MTTSALSPAERPCDVAIVGGGPAGLTAAIYAARAQLRPVVVEGVSAGGPTGGQLTLTTDVENFPGFPDGVAGPELVANMRAQAERFGARFITADVTGLTVDARPFTLSLSDGQEVSATSVIVATGASPRRLDVPGEDELWGAGVSACATCDGFFFRDRHVVVVGGGDSAMEEATFLTRFAAKVTVVHRRRHLRASQVMIDRAVANDKVEFLFDREVATINGADGQVSSVTLADTTSGEREELACDGVFLAIGHDPNSHLLSGLVATDEQGYVAVSHPSTSTSVDGVFVCGDLADATYRQAVTAAASGCRAAIDAERWLAER